ncbi:MAG: TetR family transcriptional regulator [Candidatus Nanopelagicales bacterium]
MRSARPLRPEDRTVRARIRDAAIELVATDGLAALTARRVAHRAGVSPGSVIHHFESMAGLREACDDHVAANISDQKLRAMSAGAALDVVGTLRESEAGDLLGYLTAVLAEDSPAVGRLVDEMVSDALAYIQAGVDSGMIKPTDDPRGRAVVVMLSSLGSLVMHRHLRRLLGVDLTAQGTDPAALAPYLTPTYELYAQGLFTPAFSAQATCALADLRAAGSGQPTTTNPGDQAGSGGRND